MDNVIDFKQLSAPFQDDELEWLPKTVKKDGTAALALCYVTARAIMNRLDDIVKPENWQDTYEIVGNNVKCRLSLRINGEWISKEDAADMTDIEAVKGGFSGALKRAAVKWGMGRYLYSADNVWFECESYESGGKMHFKKWKKQPRLTIDGKPVNAVKVEDDEPVTAARQNEDTTPFIAPVFASNRTALASDALVIELLALSKELGEKNPNWKRKLDKANKEDERLAMELSALGWKDDDRHAFLEAVFGVGSYTALLVSQGAALKTWAKSNLGIARKEFEGWREQYAFESLGAAS